MLLDPLGAGSEGHTHDEGEDREHHEPDGAVGGRSVAVVLLGHGVDGLVVLPCSAALPPTPGQGFGITGHPLPSAIKKGHPVSHLDSGMPKVDCWPGVERQPGEFCLGKLKQRQDPIRPGWRVQRGEESFLEEDSISLTVLPVTVQATLHHGDK